MKKNVFVLVLALMTTLFLPMGVSAASYGTDGRAVVRATADARHVVGTDYKVVLDPYLKLTWDKGNDYGGTYRAGVMGTLSKGVVVSVRPDGEFVVKNENERFRGEVIQDKYMWINKEYSHEDHGISKDMYDDALSVNEEKMSEALGKARVTVLGEGHFEGEILFTFRMERLR